MRETCEGLGWDGGRGLKMVRWVRVKDQAGK